MNLMAEVEKQVIKKRPDFNVGDVVEVHVRIVEGDKERIQVFGGTVIARTASGARETFTVRRIVEGEGVERCFPLHSPKIADIRVRKKGEVRRAKLYYLRERVGKATRIEGRTVEEAAGAPPPVAAKPAAPAAEKPGAAPPPKAKAEAPAPAAQTTPKPKPEPKKEEKK
jgi:large subunit ribosomal protein L19